MDTLLTAANWAILALIVILSLLIVRDGRDGKLKRFLSTLPAVHEAIVAWVARADTEILSDEYVARALETGRDPRALWVCDEVRDYIKRQFKIDVDVEWLYAKIEAIVASRK